LIRVSHSAPHYRADIDGLRALAIIAVVLYHAFPTSIPGGFVGVDVFFVISGFLISGILLQGLQSGTFTFSGFYANRIRRLFPALLVVLSACFVFGWFFLLPDEYSNLGKHTVGAATYIENFLLRREAGYFDVRSNLKPLMHLWSLGIEEQFYLTYPFLLWVLWRFRRHLFAIVMSVAVVSFSFNVVQMGRDPVGAFFLPQSRCWELAIGCAIACRQLPRSGRVQSSASDSLPGRAMFLQNVSSAIGVLLIVVAVFCIHENDSFPGWSALLPVCGAGLLIVGGPEAWINRKILGNRAAVLVGLISYPLYLWHWPILTFARILHAGEVSAGVRTAGLVVSFVLAWATFYFIESPIRFGPKSWIKPTALASASVVIAVLGYAAYRDGFIGRFPEFGDDLGHLREVAWSTPECRNIAGFSDIDYCRVTSARPPDVLLIGDSHAAVLYDGLAPGYAKSSLTLMNLGEAGCAPFFDTRTLSPSVRNKNCKEKVNRLLEFASQAPSVRTIIFSSRGPRYMSGEGFGPIEAGSAPEKIIWDAAPAASSQPETYALALTNTVSRLTASGKHLILFLDWPELGFDPRSCLPRPVALFSRPRAVCGVPRDHVDARNRAYRKLLSGMPSEFAGVSAFDPLPHLCDSSTCYAMKDEHLLYSDDNHVSITGAKCLADGFFREMH
jgi:peptidoglycan/LPS O-acetylase OafA/YrhL